MKYKIPFFYRKVMALAMLILFSHSMKIHSKTCIDLSKGTAGLYAMLQTTWPAHTILKNFAQEVIEKGGSYQIMENIVGDIFVNADNVIIDLNGFTMSGDVDSLIQIASGKKNIIIRNGSFVGSAENIGIVVLEGAKNILLQDLHLENFDIGIDLIGQECVPITCCRVENCFTTSCVIGYDLQYVEKTVYENCEACCCQEAGFDLSYSKYNKFKDCMAIRIGNDVPDVSAFGFTTVGGFDNLFYECFAEAIYKGGDAGDGIWCNKAIGFNFGIISSIEGEETVYYPERESKIIKCLVDSVSTPTCSWYHAMGICLESILNENEGFEPEPIATFDLDLGEDAKAVAWSPNCRYIAVVKNGDESDDLSILKFDGSSLKLLHSINEGLDDVSSIQFSYDGQFLLVTDNNGTDLEIYDVQTGALLDSVNNAAGPMYARWFYHSNKIVLSGTGGTSFYVYSFDGKELRQIAAPSLGFVVLYMSISPDDKIMAVNQGGNDTIDFIDLESFELKGGSIENIGEISSFNPLACCGKYYLAAINDAGDLRVVYYNSDTEESEVIGFIDLAQVLFNFKWHPSGKYLAVVDAVDQIYVYKFDPQAPTPVEALNELYFYITSIQPTNFIDWSPCGSHLVIHGASTEVGGEFEEYSTEIIKVGECVKCCVVDSNKVANTQGGQCAIGIFGTTCCNGITRNVGYENCINFSQGIYNAYYNGLSGPHSLLGNWGIPIY